MRQILYGIQFLHDEMEIMHRDIKPDNIMINENPLMARIIDFGTCKDLTMEPGPHTSYVSTRWYRAPECVLRSHHYNPKSDVFAVGCVMAEAYLGRPLFPGTSEMDQLEQILSILGTPKYDQWREGYRLAERRGIAFNEYSRRQFNTIFPAASEQAQEAMKIMLRISAQKRGTASEVLALPIFGLVSEEASFSDNINQAFTPKVIPALKASQVATKKP